MQIRELRPYSTIEYVGYGNLGEKGKLVPTYKGFCQQTSPFSVRKVDIFHCLLWSSERDTPCK